MNQTLKNIKAILINLAANDELPLDMNELDENLFLPALTPVNEGQQQPETFESYLAANYQPATKPAYDNYYLPKDCDYPVLHIDQIRIKFNEGQQQPAPIDELGEAYNTIEDLKDINEQEEMKRRDLLKTIYHEIDIHCLSETNHVTMDTVRNVLVKHGANEPDLW